MDTKIITDVDGKKFVEIRPAMTQPVDVYIAQLKKQIETIQSKIDSLSSQGVDVKEVQDKLSTTQDEKIMV